MKLAYKLTLACLLISLIATGLAALFIQGRVTSEFNQYLAGQQENNFVIAAKTYYQNNASWNGVDGYLRSQQLLPPLNEVNPPPQPYVLVDAARAVIVASAPYAVGEKVKQGALDKGIPIEINGKLAGTVISTGQPLIPKPVDQKYIDQINQALWIAALGSMFIALALGWLISRSVTHPIRELTHATQEMARGKLGQTIPIRSQDEMGELAQSFNRMSADLARANLARKQMTADIAHDLRNPLTVLSGYLESLQDGKLKPTPERFATMQAEARHLQRLVEDLRTLSLADADELKLNRETLPIAELLGRVANAYRHQVEQSQILLGVEIEPNLCEANLDGARMEQALGNLMSNALRHTPPGGQITVWAKSADNGVALGVRDNGSGIPADDLPRIFERSFRGDSSRSGDGSGLGLAIAKSIVQAHGGEIRAESQINKGSNFSIYLPVISKPS